MAGLPEFNDEADKLIDRAGKELEPDDYREFLQQTANKAESAEEALDEDDDQDDAMEDADLDEAEEDANAVDKDGE
jgi:hypothetical protein